MHLQRLSRCVRFGQLVGGAGFVGGEQENEWIGCLLDNLRAFGINADRWTTTAQPRTRGNSARWRNKARGGTFHGEIDSCSCRESQG